MLATTVNSDLAPASAKRQTRRWRSLDRFTPRSSAIQQATRLRIDAWALENAAGGVPVSWIIVAAHGYGTSGLHH